MENQIDDLFSFVGYRSPNSPKTSSPFKKVVKRRYINRSPSAFVTTRKKKIQVPKMPELPDLRSADEKKQEIIETIDAIITDSLTKKYTPTKSLKALKTMIIKFTEFD